MRYRGSWGIYAIWEKSIFLKKEDPQQGLSYFFRFGISDKNVNRIDTYFGSGIVHLGVFPQFHNDQIGLAMAAAHNSDKFKKAMSKGGKSLYDSWEIALELSYRAEIIDWCSIQPDLQYIINPGFNSALKNAVSLGIRMEICF